MRQIFQRFVSDENGATAIEYGMIAALIAVAIIGALRLVGSSLSSKFAAISGNLNWAARKEARAGEPGGLNVVRSRH